jgi:hypothetical protein
VGSGIRHLPEGDLRPGAVTAAGMLTLITYTHC